VGIKEVWGKVLGYMLIFRFKFNGLWEKIARATSVIVWGKIHNDMGTRSWIGFYIPTFKQERR
jgi:hypothetical protein